MARSHAKVLSRVWRDEEWRNLTMAGQWLYVVLLSQPKLTLVGSLEVTPNRWVGFCCDADQEQITDALFELRSSTLVHVDDDTEELLIRSFTKNDLDPRRLNVNLAKGLWGQWGAIESHRIRIAAVDGMPEEVWVKLALHAPEDALDIRRSRQLEPDVPTGRSDRTIEPPPSSHHPPVDFHRPSLAIGNPQAETNRNGITLVRSDNGMSA